MRGFVIALAGGTGTGKSALAGYMRRLGAAYYPVDRAAHALYERDGGVAARVSRAFGPSVLAPGGVDRARLGKLAFSSPAALRRLDAAVRPSLRREARLAVARMRLRHPVVVVEAGAILFELGLHRLADRIVVTVCGPGERARRLARSRGLPLRAARRRILLLRRTESRMSSAARRCRRSYFVGTAGGPGKMADAAVALMAEAHGAR